MRNDTAVFTAAGLSSRTAFRAIFIVSPVSHVSSTINTRFPVTRRGGPASTTGRAPLSVRVMATEAKSRCRMLATTAPGMTPALAMPMTTSGSYPRKTSSASARDCDSVLRHFCAKVNTAAPLSNTVIVPLPTCCASCCQVNLVPWPMAKSLRLPPRRQMILPVRRLIL